jgi:FKBP-type peptidyl-prolyl cis-trans isomerase
MRAPLIPAILLLAPLLLAACRGGEIAPEDMIPPPPNVAAPPADAEHSYSGLAWIVLEPGDGVTFPTGEDRVRVHYTGWQADGTMFDSSIARGEPAVFTVNRLIRGWTEGLQMMSVGEQRRLWIPSELAYGDPARRPGAPAGALVFDVHLLEVVR